MHELSLVKSIIDLLADHAEKNGWHRVSRVTLRIGRMRQVIPDVMKFSFSVAAEGTALEGAELEIIELPLAGRCRACGYAWEEELFSCPKCGSSDSEITHGMELDIDSVEVEDQDAPKDKHSPICNGGR
ncbi:MAG: hydrogenase maturation nickel metallochaperone HypA [Thermovirgaceae bacterium]|nr:hydrogenase maturation nickel metallochaperone HypA [Thermovirgaceae bacterium]